MKNPRTPLIDEDALGVVRDIMAGDFPALVGAYLAEAARLLEGCEQAAANDDHDALQRAAHSLKSASANIGAARLAETARLLERKGRDGDGSGTGPLLEQARSLFGLVRTRLETTVG